MTKKMSKGIVSSGTPVPPQLSENKDSKHPLNSANSDVPLAPSIDNISQFGQAFAPRG